MEFPEKIDERSSVGHSSRTETWRVHQSEIVEVAYSDDGEEAEIMVVKSSAPAASAVKLMAKALSDAGIESKIEFGIDMMSIGLHPSSVRRALRAISGYFQASR